MTAAGRSGTPETAKRTRRRVDRVQERSRLYWELFDFGVGRGLEIGPLHRSIVRKQDADVRYVDVHDQDRLRAHYAGDAGINPDLIPEIDYTLIRPDDTVVSLVEATAEGAPFAWVVASHVIEHVPDVIGWLAELAEIVEDAAVLVLAVPDRRFCFDVNRPPTTVGQMLQAHLDADTVPSTRAVYDYFSSVVDNDIADLWRGVTPDRSRRLHSPQYALDKVAQQVSGTYVDCHVWLFSPQSFVEQMHELRVTGHSAWVVEEIIPTPAHDVEFRVRMRRLPRTAAGTTTPQTTEVTPSSARPDWQVAPDVSALVPHLETQIADLRAQLKDVRTRFRARRTRDAHRLTQARGEIESLRRERDELVRRRLSRLGAALYARVGAARRSVARRSS